MHGRSIFVVMSAFDRVPQKQWPDLAGCYVHCTWKDCMPSATRSGSCSSPPWKGAPLDMSDMWLDKSQTCQVKLSNTPEYNHRKDLLVMSIRSMWFSFLYQLVQVLDSTSVSCCLYVSWSVDWPANDIVPVCGLRCLKGMNDCARFSCNPLLCFEAVVSYKQVGCTMSSCLSSSVYRVTHSHWWRHCMSSVFGPIRLPE